MNSWILATRSAHKAAEIKEILGPGVSLITLDEAGVDRGPEEDGLEPYDTFEENAVSKARYFAKVAGRPVIADDSGLQVDALGGRPGVRTKRFAPPGRYPGLPQDAANNRYLLEQLAEVTDGERGCRYVCVAALAQPTGAVPRVFRGEAAGVVLREPLGEGGFGYDPVIQDPRSGRSFAQLTPAEKHARSHRGEAFRAVARYLAGDPTRPVQIAPTPDGHALAIHWGDGEQAVYLPRDLRLACPCAGCIDEMTGRPILQPGSVPETIFPVRIQHVGRYALQFFWSDGHDTGLYTYRYLRELWERSLSGSVGQREHSVGDPPETSVDR